MGGTHWTCFHVKDNISFYFDSFDGQPNKFILEQLPKRITFHNFEIQHINSRFFKQYITNNFKL